MPEGPEGPKRFSEGPESLPEGPEGLPEGPEGLPEGPEDLPDGPESLPEGHEGLPEAQGDVRMDRCTDRWTNRISPHSTGLCPLLGPLPKKIGCAGVDFVPEIAEHS